MAGYRYGSGLYDVGSNGLYWSSSLYEYLSDGAWHLSFGSDGHYLINDCRWVGRSVRPVLP